MNQTTESDRREILRRITLAGAGFAVAGAAASVPPEEHGGEEVAPAEDLMREHGVLNRVLLVYDEFLRRLSGATAIEKRLGIYELAKFTP
jgi:hypothetical protein